MDGHMDMGSSNNRIDFLVRLVRKEGIRSGAETPMRAAKWSNPYRSAPDKK